jgi:hypothetical protein
MSVVGETPGRGPAVVTRRKIRKGHRVVYGGALTTKFRKVRSGCWLWRGAKNSKGYGELRVGPRVRPAHRAVWEALVGPCPAGLEFHHTCGRAACVNPAHAQWILPCVHWALGHWG